MMLRSGVATGLFSSWSPQADLEDAHNVAVDQATLAELQRRNPGMVALYLDDDLPEPIEHLLDRAIAAAGSRDEDSFLARYQKALAALLGN